VESPGKFIEFRSVESEVKVVPY